MNKSVRLLLAAAVFFSGGLAFCLAARDDEKPAAKPGSAMAQAHPTEAKAMLAHVKQLWDVDAAATESPGRSIFRNAEEVHLWSCRLLEAERALADTRQDDRAAVLNHWRRMEDTYRKIKALFDTGAKGGETDRLAAARYYRAEAELWLAAAGGSLPEDRLE